MVNLVDLMTGPQLYRKFLQGEHKYTIPEYLGNTTMSFCRGLFYFSTSLAFGPVIVCYLYNRNYLQPQTILFILKYAGLMAMFGLMGRFIGRSMDPLYKEFIGIYAKARASGKPEDNDALKQFDFELFGVNADYTALPNKDLWYNQPNETNANPFTKIASLYAIKSFGRHMLYPGSMALLNYLLHNNLQLARGLLVTRKGGKRVWIRSTQGDLIDAMYVSAPEFVPDERKDTLVICCEGNAGFYEIGIVSTPAELGYHVLGWNHPGFGESSGLPYPERTLAAADSVMQYAINVLKFKEENIVLFGWSIGGYPSSWLAANYPKIKGLVLDATFDDVLPLAIARMPKFLSGVVEYAVRNHFNLEIHRILAKYKGPLRLIRRLQEEILTTDDTGGEEEKRASNRANFLLKEVIKVRHPDVIHNLEPLVDRWLAMSPNERAMSAHESMNTGNGEILAKLFQVCDHYLVDFDATHVTPLDPGYFNIPTEYRE
ncbi:unnamed protein product [Auanema sp. JU1783]|nr:unnamed protein product [Auanema sp. JU1783]